MIELGLQVVRDREPQVERLKRSLRLLVACNRALVRATQEQDLLQTVCQLMIEVGGYRLAGVGYLQHDEDKTVQPISWAGEGTDELKNIQITWADTAKGNGSVSKAIRSRQPHVSQDLQTDLNYLPWQKIIQQQGHKSAIFLPLIDDEVFGVLTIYAAEIDVFQADEVQLLTELANDLSDRITALRTEYDITDRQVAEADLFASRQQFQNLVENSPDIIERFDLQLRHLYVSPVLSDITGIPTEEFLGKTCRELGLDRVMIDTWEAAVFKSLATRQKQTIDFDLPTLKGVRFFEMAIVPELSPRQTIESILCISRDVTDRKQAEADRLQAQQIHHELKLLENILDIILAGYWDWDIPNHQEYLSLGLKRMFGYEDAELPNVPETWQRLIFAEDLPGVLDCLDRHVQSHGQIPFHNEVRYRHKNGATVWVICSGRVIDWDAQGNPLRMIGCHIDITERQAALHERKQAEVQLRQTNAELTRATRLKDEFLATMSHELRTPLNAILGMTEGLLEQVFGSINQKQQHCLETIERSGYHLLELINDILDVAKIEAGQIALNCTSIDLLLLCQSSLTFVKPQALKKQIQIATKLPSDLPNLFADERRIRQVLINLLSNAVKFTPEGGHITLEAKCPDNSDAEAPPPNYLRIAIVDTGIGIAPEHTHKLFQPFVQIDSALNRQYPGTGLGLALVKSIVELHGGEVGVTSEVGVGSCFAIDLPYHQ